MLCVNDIQICNIQICNIPTSTYWPDSRYQDDNDVRIIKIELKVFPISESWWSVYKSNYFYQWGPSVSGITWVHCCSITSDNLNKSSNYIFNSLYVINSHFSHFSTKCICTYNITYVLQIWMSKHYNFKLDLWT